MATVSAKMLEQLRRGDGSLSDGQLLFNAEHTNPPGGLEKYYRDNVIGGPGAFVMVAEDFNAFGKAIVKKMIAEIAAAPSPRRRTASAQ